MLDQVRIFSETNFLMLNACLSCFNFQLFFRYYTVVVSVNMHLFCTVLLFNIFTFFLFLVGYLCLTIFQESSNNSKEMDLSLTPAFKYMTCFVDFI